LYDAENQGKSRVKISGSANHSVCIPVSHKQRFENPGKIDLVQIEVQCSECLGEADIVRPPGHYGRA
jgi:mannose-1-phosphate guanylyltransferase